MRNIIFRTDRRDYVLIFLSIVATVVPWLPSVLSLGLKGGLAVYGLYKIVQRKKKLSFAPDFVILMLLFLFLAILDIRNVSAKTSYSLTNISFPFCFFIGYVLAKLYERNRFYEIYENIVFVLSCLSLIGMLAYLGGAPLIRSFPVYTFNGSQHHTLYFSNYLFSDGWMAVRNCGIAWEPGLFQMLLNIAFQIAIRKMIGKKLFYRSVIYGVAIVLTKSTMGYICLLINIVWLIRKDKRYLVFLICVTLAFFSTIYSEIMVQATSKLSRGTVGFDARYNPTVNAIKFGWYRPLGIGATMYNKVYVQEGIGSFDSYTQILLRYGYSVLIYVIWKLVRIMKNDFTIGLIISVSMLTEPVWGGILFVIFYYLNDNNKEKTKRDKEKTKRGKRRFTLACKP